MNGLTVWVVGKSLGLESTWEFQGVFLSAAAAEAVCRDNNYFIAPAVIGAVLPDEKIVWEGLRWPFASPVHG